MGGTRVLTINLGPPALLYKIHEFRSLRGYLAEAVGWPRHRLTGTVGQRDMDGSSIQLRKEQQNVYPGEHTRFRTRHRAVVP
jgi:hypothetical protein